MQAQPDRSCQAANQIAQAQLADIRSRIARLRALETELTRIAAGCSGRGTVGACHVLAALADHDSWVTDH